jgi:chromate transporter
MRVVSPPAQSPGLLDLCGTFLRLGSTAFGGPAMVTYIRQVAVVRRGWIHADDFTQGVALCQALPGATAMQCAAWVGWRTRGLRGAVAAYVGFGLPAFVVMLLLAAGYRRAITIDAVSAAMANLQALVVALVAYSAWSLGRPAVHARRDLAVVLLTGTSYLLGASPFAVVAGAGVVGAVTLRRKVAACPQGPVRRGWQVWRAPLAVLGAMVVLVVGLLLAAPRLATLALLMLKIDAFAFGGGYASVPLMLHEVVTVRGWLPAGVFMDGIVLGQVTPGPLVITAAFVGYQAFGLAGAIVATLGVFLPSLFAVVLVEPWFRRLQSSPACQGVMRALVLSFIGLLLSVTVVFARAVPWTPITAVMAAAALVALWRKVDVVWVVLAGAALAAVIR